jgi:hypothetical protein
VQSWLSIIGNVESKSQIIIALACLVASAACGNKLQTRDAVERGIRKGVQQRGLNLETMEIKVENVNFHDNKADATVGFFPKGGQLSQGMMMHYTLEQRDNEWVITGRSQSDMHQHSGGMQMGAPKGAMPMGTSGGMQMPAGHPAVPGTPK